VVFDRFLVFDFSDELLVFSCQVQARLALARIGFARRGFAVTAGLGAQLREIGQPFDDSSPERRAD
jgi:hypothetical protein